MPAESTFDITQLRQAKELLERLIQLIESGKVEEAVSKLPPAGQQMARQIIADCLRPAGQHTREWVDTCFGIIAAHTGLPEAKALYGDLVDEHG